MKKITLLSLVLVLVFSSWMGWAEEKKSALPEKVIDVRYEKCPISGGKVQPDVFSMIEGKVYHFCCPACVKPFEKDFAAKVKTIENPTEVALKIANVDGKCPKTGKPAVSGIFRIKGDSITFYCCDKCPPKLEIIDMDDDADQKDGKPTTDKPAEGSK